MNADWQFPWPEDQIAQYTAYRATGPISIDGHLDEPSWQQAPRSPRFRDMIKGRPGIHDTRAAVLWDDDNLYVGFWVEEPYVEAALTERDDPVCSENDVEFFLGGKDSYYEFEINALGTINDNSDRDRGWRAELALAWTGMKWLAKADDRSLPPQDGDMWQMDFSRFNTYKEAPPADDPGGWAWSPHGAWDSHMPEVWPKITFSTRPVSEAMR